MKLWRELERTFKEETERDRDGGRERRRGRKGARERRGEATVGRI